MAHIAVARRSMTTLEWIEIRLKWLETRVIMKRLPLPGWKIREARQTGLQDYQFFDAEYRDLLCNDTYFTPEGTSFIKSEVELPADWIGKSFWLEWFTAGEMIVKINGAWVGGLDPNRLYMKVPERFNQAPLLKFEIEGYNRSKPDDERNPSTVQKRGCRQKFRGAYAVIFDENVQPAVLDAQVILEMILSPHTDSDLKERLVIHLDKALAQIGTQSEFLESDQEIISQKTALFRKYLKTEIYDQTLAGRGGKVALCAHSHLDIAYFWRTIHATQKNARTCLIQLRLMEDYPEFTYCHTQAYLYENLENNYPDLFQELKKKVADGRFEVTGGMYVEPDCNVPAAESLIRQTLYAQRYFKKTFGKVCESAWLPDVFGMSWIIPQIFRCAGMKYFVINKIYAWNDTNRFPYGLFQWRGINGSEISTCVPPGHFITWNDPSQIQENWKNFQSKTDHDESLNLFGFGDGGSGVTVKMLENMERLNHISGVPECRQIRGDHYLKDAFAGKKNLPIFDDELYLEMHRGTFTTKGELKKANRRMEELARTAEILSALALTCGEDYPMEKITSAWKLILLNQFHDILPGTHIAPVTVDALNDLGKAKEIFGDIASEKIRVLSTHCLSKEIPSVHNPSATQPTKPGDRITLQVFTPLTHDSQMPFFVSADLFPSNKKPSLIQRIDENGIVSEPLQFQKSEESERTGYLIDSTLPGLSVQSFLICLEDANSSKGEVRSKETNKTEPNTCAWFQWDKLSHIFESDLLKIKFTNAGAIESFLNKPEEKEVIEPGTLSNDLHIYHDYPGNYDAWDILQDYKNCEDGPLELSSPIALINAGDLFAELEVVYKLKRSSWRQRIRIHRKNAMISFDNRVEWFETNRLAKVWFTPDLLCRDALCDIGAGYKKCPTHTNTSWEKARFEVAHHKWFTLSESAFSMMICNDSRYGVSFEKNRAGLSLLRSPIRPDRYSDHGVNTFRYAMMPLFSDVVNQSNRLGWEYNTSVICSVGSGAPKKWLDVSQSNLQLSSFKAAEDYESEGNSFVLRLCEESGKRGRGKITLPFEVKRAERVDLLEGKDYLERESRVECIGNTIEFHYLPFEIVNIKVQPIV